MTGIPAPMYEPALHPKVEELLALLAKNFGVQTPAVKVVVTLEAGEPVRIEQTYLPNLE